MAAPAGEVHGTQCDVRPLRRRVALREKRCRAVEGAEAVGSTAVGSKGLTVSGRQSGPKDPPCGSLGVPSGGGQ